MNININTNQTQSGVAVRRMYARQNNNKKTVSAPTEKNKSVCDGLIDNIKKLIEDKKKQIQEVKADDSLPPQLKEVKLDILQDRLQELENQLNQAIMEKQKRDAEELVRKQNEKAEEKNNNDTVGDTKTQRFINTFSKVAFNFNSIQQNKITKAEKERDAKRIEIEAEHDTERGIIGDKADELYKTSLASSKLNNEIKEKTSEISKDIKEYREKEIEEAEKPESEKSNEEKTEEKVFGNAEEEETSTKETSSEETTTDNTKKENIPHNIYSNNSIDNLLEKESIIDTNC